MTNESKMVLFGSTELDSAEAEKIAGLVPDSASAYVLHSADAIAKFNKAVTETERQKEIGKARTAKAVAIDGASLKKVYQPAKSKKQRGDNPTYADIARSLSLSPTYYSQLCSIGERIYLKDDETATALSENMTPSTLIKLLPLEDKILSEVKAGIADGSFRLDMTQKEVAEWVDERIEHLPTVEDNLVILNPLTGERIISTLSAFLDGAGLDKEWKLASHKTGQKEEIAPTLALEWTAHFYRTEDFRSMFVFWTRKHKMPKPSKESVQNTPLNPEEVLRQSLERMGYSPEMIETVLSMQNK